MTEQIDRNSLIIASNLIDSLAPLLALALLAAAGIAVARAVREYSLEHLVWFLLILIVTGCTLRKTTLTVEGREERVYLLPKTVNEVAGTLGNLVAKIAAKDETEAYGYYYASITPLPPQMKSEIIEAYEACVLPVSLKSGSFLTDIYSPVFKDDCEKKMSHIRSQLESRLRTISRQKSLKQYVNFIFFKEAGIKPETSAVTYSKTAVGFNSPLSLVSYGNQRADLARAHIAGISIIALASAVSTVSLPLFLLIFPLRPRIILFWAACVIFIRLSAIVPAFMLNAAASGGFDSSILFSVTKFGGIALAVALVIGTLWLHNHINSRRT